MSTVDEVVELLIGITLYYLTPCFLFNAVSLNVADVPHKSIATLCYPFILPFELLHQNNLNNTIQL